MKDWSRLSETVALQTIIFINQVAFDLVVPCDLLLPTTAADDGHNGEIRARNRCACRGTSHLCGLRAQAHAPNVDDQQRLALDQIIN